MLPLRTKTGTIDTCGTGGDGAGTFNISTTVALVVAGAGVPVAKHGNRNASSRCGSADVLEALGVTITLSPEHAAAILSKIGVVFLFAPTFHPALKHLSPVRKELGFRTVFNYLGPLCNPAGVKRQIVGVPDAEAAMKLAEVATGLQYDYLLLVSNEDGLDEIGLNAPTHAIEVRGREIQRYTIDPRDWGIPPAPVSALAGGDATENATFVRAVLSGENGPHRDIVVLNAAYALLVSGTVKDVPEGIARAKKSIDSGAAGRKLKELITHSTTV
jgi:anthranilate phosphoribosyltransferase